jgi:hypothetical protein
MKQLISILILVLVLSPTVYASTTDCQNLYIGRIWIEKGIGLKSVVYLNSPNNTSGSYWSSFSGWTPDEKKEALSILLMAKAAQHKVNVTTENTDGCGLQSGYITTKSLYLATNP